MHFGAGIAACYNILLLSFFFLPSNNNFNLNVSFIVSFHFYREPKKKTHFYMDSCMCLCVFFTFNLYIFFSSSFRRSNSFIDNDVPSFFILLLFFHCDFSYNLTIFLQLNKMYMSLNFIRLFSFLVWWFLLFFSSLVYLISHYMILLLFELEKLS